MYLLRDEKNILNFDHHYHQLFLRQPRRSHGLPEYEVIAQFVDEPEPRRALTIEILSFLRKYVFATREQIARMLAYKGYQVQNLDAVLDEFAGKCYLNYFVLATKDETELSDDALRIYCLDTGALVLLSHFTALDCLSWFTTDVIRNGGLVIKYLATVNFILRLYELKGEAVASVLPELDHYMGRRIVRFSAAVTVMNGFSPLDYLIDVVREENLPEVWPRRCSEQLGAYFEGKRWNKMYNAMPTYILLCENVDVGLRAAERLAMQVEGLDIRVVLDSYTDGMENAVLAYDAEQGILTPVDEL